MADEGKRRLRRIEFACKRGLIFRTKACGGKATHDARAFLGVDLAIDECSGNHRADEQQRIGLRFG